MNSPFKLFPATVAYADIGSIKSLHTFLLRCLYHMLVKCEQNRMVETKRNYKKPGFLKPFLKNADAILEDISVAKTIV